MNCILISFVLIFLGSTTLNAEIFDYNFSADHDRSTQMNDDLSALFVQADAYIFKGAFEPAENLFTERITDPNDGENLESNINFMFDLATFYKHYGVIHKYIDTLNSIVELIKDNWGIGHQKWVEALLRIASYNFYQKNYSYALDMLNQITDNSDIINAVDDDFLLGLHLFRAQTVMFNDLYKKDDIQTKEEYYDSGNTLKRRWSERNGCRIGKYTEFYPNGKIKCEEFYYNGFKHGHSKEFYENGALQYERNYDTGRVDGISKEYYSNSVLARLLNYDKGVESGRISLFYPNGNLFATSNLENNKLSGPHTEYYDNGTILSVGFFTDNKYDGQWTIYYPNGAVRTELNYIRGAIDGSVKQFTPAGELLSKTHYNNGTFIRQIDHTKNQIVNTELTFNVPSLTPIENGQRTSQYLNGQLRSLSNYSHWMTNGKTEHYFYDGTLKTKLRHTNGVFTGRCELFYPNGQLYLLGKYKNGEFEGVVKIYHENGRLFKKFDYKNGVPQGTVSIWYENGQRLSEFKLVDGTQNGTIVSYHPNGTIHLQTHFANGQIESQSFYNDINIKAYESDNKHQTFYRTGQLHYEWYMNDKNGLTLTEFDIHGVGIIHLETSDTL